MNDLTVEIGDLHTAAQQISQVADGMRSTDVSGDIDSVAQALPRSASADAARRLARAWSARVRGIAATADKHEQNFVFSASAYAASDQRAAQLLRSLQSKPGSGGGLSDGLASPSCAVPVL